MPPQATPSLKRFSSTYDDPFSDVATAFDISNPADPVEADAPSIDRDNKLLSFSSPKLEFPLLDYTYRRTTVNIAAQLHGMFFLAESPWAAVGDAPAPPPTELTCYRRNLYQISGRLELPKSLRYIVSDQGEQMPMAIMSQELAIQATESTEGNPVKIISVPWKTPANPSTTAAEDKVEREPPSIPLDLANAQEPEAAFATFPFQWKRLQFRIATANNGRRKELQQHFVVRLDVMATLATGGKVSIAHVHSGPIIVRGRSPRNFQSRKDTPLTGGSGHARKPTRTTLGGEGSKRASDGPTSAPAKAGVAALPAVMPAVHDEDEDPVNLNFKKDWNAAAVQYNMPVHGQVDMEPNERADAYRDSHAGPSQDTRPPAPPPAPISLKLVEDDSPKATKTSQTAPDPRAAKRIHIPPRPPSFSLNTLNSPDESADLLYEYFPLSISDWSEPVDAVYRPHVVHHIGTKVSIDPRDPSATRTVRSKRMYVE